MNDFRTFDHLTADAPAASVYARIADLHDEAVLPEWAPRPAAPMTVLRDAWRRFVDAQPAYAGQSYLRA
ncbi:hypothetical protein [Tsukamurella sp. 1534]|uniref:hypothetical protein n=1 Tax=Tsukamurella sp. 1534 TaxID=1151061 RepID=UPI0011D19AE1|nr:hypothetical protein [Tsukamurella sp. 1534]